MITPTQSIPFLYYIQQNKNEDSKAYGKWYGKSIVLSTMETKDVADDMIKFGSIYGKSVIEGVLEDFYFAMLTNYIIRNHRVKMPGLGIIYAGLRTEGADAPENFKTRNIKGLRIGLIPDNSESEQLSSKKFRNRIKFTRRPTSKVLSNALYVADENQQGDIENP